MSHGIEKMDRGVVWGTTWHQLSQYIQQEGPVTYEQAKEVLDFPIEKVPLVWEAGVSDSTAHIVEVPGAFALVRPDIDKVLVPMVGARFEVVPNTLLLDAVQDEVLSQAPSLDIESVGTLFGGATQFVNVKINEYAVNGDDSPTVSRLMYYNPLGRGCYQVVAHNVRVVCNNTLTCASTGAKQRVKVRHTKSAGTRISAAMLDMARIYADFDDQKQLLEMFAREPMSAIQVATFIDNFIPTPEREEDEEPGRSFTMAANDQAELYSQFATGDEAMTKQLKHSKYGMLQAVTYLLDHEDPKRGHDEASIIWDGIVGSRSTRKQVAVDLLQKA